MKSQETASIQKLNLTENEKEVIRLQRIENILNLIQSITETLPPMVKMMVMTYQSTVRQSLTNLTYEQTELVIEKAEDFIKILKGEKDEKEL